MSGDPLPPWPLPPSRPTLTADDVHVWRVSLRVPRSSFVQLHGTLSPDERDRAARYRFLSEQQRFVVGRGWLRAILSLYLALDATQVRFSYNPNGKPELCAPQTTPAVSPSRSTSFAPALRPQQRPGVAASDEQRQAAASGLNEDGAPTAAGPAQHRLQFNLAHSGDLAICAISCGRRVGVDVEQIRSGFADGTLAESFLAPPEVAALRSLPARGQERAFFTCWTRKEAYLKARGEGLIVPLDAFEVSLRPEDAPVLVQTPSDPAEAARWSLFELDIGPGYAASLAVEGQGCHLWLWQDACPDKHVLRERKRA
jgi:4'-phosphopantetheinyl transferase